MKKIEGMSGSLVTLDTNHLVQDVEKSNVPGKTWRSRKKTKQHMFKLRPRGNTNSSYEQDWPRIGQQKHKGAWLVSLGSTL